MRKALTKCSQNNFFAVRGEWVASALTFDHSPRWNNNLTWLPRPAVLPSGVADAPGSGTGGSPWLASGMADAAG